MTQALWQPEHPAGHAPYCAHPYHSTYYYCSASEAEPQTLLGQPSTAWHRDHPQQAAGRDGRHLGSN